uniref:tetratricopeptide repeat protein n=1 Tax=Rhodococcus qingshengii TaxID=334542 RepID=UPI001C4E105F|nr:tetratricopeptide repeat protein [Rhodococcus qingshengii]
MLRNPLWVPNAAPALVQEILDSASFRQFTGRTEEVSIVESWTMGDKPGVFVIAGSAGSGKTALLGHVMAQFNTPPVDESIAPESTLKSRSYSQVSARGLDHTSLAARIEQGLVASGALEALTHPRNVLELLGALDRLRHSVSADPRSRLPVIGVDGLNESPSHLHDIVDRLLIPMGEFAVVVVTTRRTEMTNLVSSQNNLTTRQTPTSQPAASTLDVTDVITSLDRILDLDSVLHRASGWLALTQSVETRLSGVSETMDSTAVAATIQQMTGEQNPPPFLLMELICDHFANSPVDTSAPEWQAQVTASIAVTLNQVVQESVSDEPQPRHDAVGAAQHLFESLQWGLGAGFPEDHWLAVANATDPQRNLGREDIDWLLAALGKYVVEDSEHGVAVYRCAHPLIAQHFHTKAIANEGPGEIELRVAQALLNTADALTPASANLADAHLSRYLWRYLMRAGEPGLALLKDRPALAAQHPVNLTYATLGVSIAALESADVARATELAERTITQLQDSDLQHSGPIYAQAHAHLALCFQSSGQVDRAVRSAGAAVNAYAILVQQDSQLVPDYVAVVHNLATMLMDAGRPQAAVDAAARAADLEREFLDHGGNNYYRLGITLNVLALAHSDANHAVDAVTASKDSVDALRQAVALRNRVLDRIALAESINNLGGHLAATGNLRAGLSAAEEGLQILEQMATEDSTLETKLAGAKNDMANRLMELGEYERALTLMDEVINTLRSTENPRPKERVQLFGALNNCAAILLSAGATVEAARRGQAAVQLARTIAAEQPADKGCLAMALDNFANCMTRLSEHHAAIQLTQESLEIYRDIAARNEGDLVHVARVLLNYGDRLAHVGRAEDAVVATEEARDLYRKLGTDNPLLEVEVARTVAQLAIHQLAAGNRATAATTSEEAVQLCDDMAARKVVDEIILAEALSYALVQATRCALDPDLLLEFAQRAVSALATTGVPGSPKYAVALRNLAAVHGTRGDFAVGHEYIRQAVEVLSKLAQEDRAFEVELASALGIQARLEFSLSHHGQGIRTALSTLPYYERLPERTPANLETCAEVLALLATEGIAFDPQLPVAAHVDRMLRPLDGVQRAGLLGNIVSRMPPLSPFTPQWLIRALDELGQDEPPLCLHLRTLARSSRNFAPDLFDLVWSLATRADPPPWLVLDPYRLDTALTWVSSATHQDGYEFLLAHRYLVESSFDPIMDEAYLGISPERVPILREIRSAASVGSIDDAYQKPLAADVADAFAEADLDTQLELLSSNGEELRSDMVKQHLRDRAREGDEPGTVAYYLVKLSENDLHDAVISAISDPDKAQEVLGRIAHEHDQPMLARAVQLLITPHPSRAPHFEVQGLAAFYMCAVLIGKGDEGQASDLMMSVRALAPDRISSLTTAAARLGAAKPEFLQLIPLLIETNEVK